MNLKIHSDAQAPPVPTPRRKTLATLAEDTAAAAAAAPPPPPQLTMERWSGGADAPHGVPRQLLRDRDRCQRALDLLLSVMILAALMPLFVVVAMAVIADSPGPVLFKQKRVGIDGREFWFYKFRSMVADAESQRQALLRHNESTGPMFKMRRDPRITRSGRWLRRLSLDELPQLINVLMGDMSLVGPRPALPVEVAKYTPRERGRLAVRPGITGLWQVSGRSELSFEQCVDLDLEYVRRQSPVLYAKILMRTVPAVASGRGAY